MSERKALPRTPEASPSDSKLKDNQDETVSKASRSTVSPGKDRKQPENQEKGKIDQYQTQTGVSSISTYMSSDTLRRDLDPELYSKATKVVPMFGTVEFLEDTFTHDKKKPGYPYKTCKPKIKTSLTTEIRKWNSEKYICADSFNFSETWIRDVLSTPVMAEETFKLPKLFDQTKRFISNKVPFLDLPIATPKLEFKKRVQPPSAFSSSSLSSTELKTKHIPMKSPIEPPPQLPFDSSAGPSWKPDNPVPLRHEKSILSNLVLSRSSSESSTPISSPEHKRASDEKFVLVPIKPNFKGYMGQLGILGGPQEARVVSPDAISSSTMEDIPEVVDSDGEFNPSLKSKPDRSKLHLPLTNITAPDVEAPRARLASVETLTSPSTTEDVIEAGVSGVVSEKISEKKESIKTIAPQHVEVRTKRTTFKVFWNRMKDNIRKFLKNPEPEDTENAEISSVYRILVEANEIRNKERRNRKKKPDTPCVECHNIVQEDRSYIEVPHSILSPISETGESKASGAYTSDDNKEEK